MLMKKGNAMKTLLLSASAILPLLTGIPAKAADIPPRAPLYKAQPPAAYDWTGLYFGGHLGSGWTAEEWRFLGLGITRPFNLGSGNAPGFFGGAQIGINYQVDAMVFGLEADVSWADLSGDACNAPQGGFLCNSKADRFGTITGRFGIPVDRALVYFKAGAAWIHDTRVLTIVNFPEVTTSSNKWGWTAGAGVEYALTRNWSAKLEYDFIGFGTNRVDFDLGPAGLAIIPIDVKHRIQAVKLGLNYKLDWGPPVAASY